MLMEEMLDGQIAISGVVSALLALSIALLAESERLDPEATPSDLVEWAASCR
jgi:hypothetical protein